MSGSIVIIGAGHGGVQLAASLRDAGFDGAITLISEESDTPYHKPPLSKSFMQTADAPLQELRALSYFEKKSINLRLGQRVSTIDREAQCVVFDDVQRLEYGHLVLATGMRVRQLTIAGSELDNIYYLRTAEDARKLRNGLPESGDVVVIGGGFIGLEAAAMLSARGLSVTVVEVAERLLGRAVSEVTAEAVKQHLLNSGVRIICGTGVTALQGDNGKVSRVELDNAESLNADLVIAGIGGLVEDQLARDAGLQLENGIVTDELLSTSDTSISAIGDCVSFPRGSEGKMIRLESVQNATDQARVLAKTLTGHPTPYRTLPWFWSDMGDLKLQIAGLADSFDEYITVRRDDGTLQSVWRMQGDKVAVVETLNSPGEHMLSRRLIDEEVCLDKTIIASGDMTQLKAAYRQAKQASEL